MYLGLLGLAILIRAMLVDDGSGLLYQLIPAMDAVTGNRLQSLTAYSALALAPMFLYNLYQYPRFRNYIRFFQYEAGLFAVSVLIFPWDIHYKVSHNIYNLSIIAAFVVVLFILLRAIKHKMVGAKSVLYGVVIGFAFIFLEIVKRSGFAPNFDIQGPNLVNTGIILMFFFMSIALSKIYAHLSQENEKLNRGLEERVSTRTEQLSKSNLIQERFIRIMSHDFRAPMASVKSMLGLMEDDAISKEQSKELQSKIKKSLDQSLEMLDDLLEWTKASSQSNIELLQEKIDLKKVIVELVDYFNATASDKGIRLELVPSGVRRTFVKSDANSIKVVIRNLISNAIKFTEKGGSIEVGYKRKGQTVEVIISDTGIGVPEEMKATIFEMDSKNKRLGTGNEKSTGVGLALCQDLINQNGGKIWLEENSPKGTIFKFTLEHSS